MRPSVVFSDSDNFSTQFMTLLNLLPFFPLYYSGKTKFMPIHCSDLTDVIHYSLIKNINSQIIECVGPQTLSFKEIIKILLDLIGKKRLLLPLPLSLANLSARFFQLFPRPLLTQDQLRLLKYDNVLSGKYKNNSDLNFNCASRFEEEVNKYSYMWKDEGEYSKKGVN